jgi:type IV secretory pathway TrbD component
MMNLVLSIVGMSLAIALFAPKLDWRAYTGLGLWIVGACAFYYVKH